MVNPDRFGRLGKDLAMHIAAHDPRPVCVSEDQVPADMIAHEREPLPLPSTVNPNISEEIERILDSREIIIGQIRDSLSSSIEQLKLADTGQSP